MVEETESPKTVVEEPPRPAAGVLGRSWLYAVLGWLVPGLGHLLLRKFDRAVVFFFSIVTMAGLGLAMGGKLYAPPFSAATGAFLTLLHVLSFLGDLGAGVIYFAAQLASLGGEYMGESLGDYGTVFFLCAGLLNLLIALDAHDIASGKKQ
ncbi:hypothetical protein MYX77_06165 [Acidobacteriia bacterium AH_259_A11_L15]|nr:hypothetical protein [Acidobacteriia bacterium AH_259_A11_L15]